MSFYESNKEITGSTIVNNYCKYCIEVHVNQCSLPLNYISRSAYRGMYSVTLS